MTGSLPPAERRPARQSTPPTTPSTHRREGFEVLVCSRFDFWRWCSKASQRSHPPERRCGPVALRTPRPRRPQRGNHDTDSLPRFWQERTRRPGLLVGVVASQETAWCWACGNSIALVTPIAESVQGSGSLWLFAEHQRSGTRAGVPFGRGRCPGSGLNVRESLRAV